MVPKHNRFYKWYRVCQFLEPTQNVNTFTRTNNAGFEYFMVKWQLKD